MSQFATFSHFDGQRRTAIRLSADGRASLLVTARHGEVVQNIEETIDPARANALVLDAAMLTPDLRNTGGDYSIGFGEGEGQPTIWSMHEHDLPLDAMVFAQSMLQLCDSIGRSYVPEVHAPETRAQSIGMTPGDFVKWSLAFFGGHVAATIASLLLLVMLAKVANILGLIVGVVLAAVMVGAAYFVIGRMHGAKFAQSSDVWKPAAAAIVVPAVIGAMAGGGFSLGIGLIYPLIARWGANTAA